MGRRDLLTEDERRALFGVPDGHEALVRHYTLSRADLDLVRARRGDANRLGMAVQLALLRHPGFGFAVECAPSGLVAFMAAQIEVPPSAFADYGTREQTVNDHARALMDTMGVRPSAEADFLPMIEAAALAAWSTDRGVPIASSIVDALRADRILLPTLGRLERAGIAGRARARMRTYAALLDLTSPTQLGRLDALLEVGEKGVTPLAWMREVATAPKADNVRGLLDRLNFVRGIGIAADVAGRVHPDRFRQLVREGRVSSAQLLSSYTTARRRATLAALLIDLEARLTDATLDMADRMIGGSFTRGGNAKKRIYAATTRDVGRLMAMFHRTIDALGSAQEGNVDAFVAVDQAVGWDKLLRARPEVAAIAELAEEDPLVRAADRWVTLRKFAPALLKAVDFKATRGSGSTLAAIDTLREMNRSGKREVPKDAPMPFKKEWRTLVVQGGKIDRRLPARSLAQTSRLRSPPNTGRVASSSSGSDRQSMNRYASAPGLSTDRAAMQNPVKNARSAPSSISPEP